MIRGVFTVVKGGFPRICRRTAGGGDSRLRGNDVGGRREWGNAKAQGRNEKQAGDSRLRGNDGRGVGMTTGGFAIRRRPILRKGNRNHHEESLAIERRLRA